MCPRALTDIATDYLVPQYVAPTTMLPAATTLNKACSFVGGVVTMAWTRLFNSGQSGRFVITPGTTVVGSCF